VRWHSDVPTSYSAVTIDHDLRALRTPSSTNVRSWCLSCYDWYINVKSWCGGHESNHNVPYVSQKFHIMIDILINISLHASLCSVNTIPLLDISLLFGISHSAYIHTLNTWRYYLSVTFAKLKRSTYTNITQFMVLMVGRNHDPWTLESLYIIWKYSIHSYRWLCDCWCALIINEVFYKYIYTYIFK